MKIQQQAAETRLWIELKNVTTRQVGEKQESQDHEQNISIGEVRSGRSRDYCLAGEAFRYNPTKEYNKQKCVVIAEMTQLCEICCAKKFSRGTPRMCCMSGKIL